MVQAAADVRTATEAIKTTAPLTRGSNDNITVIVLDLREYTANLSRHEMEIVKVVDKAIENS